MKTIALALVVSAMCSGGTAYATSNFEQPLIAELPTEITLLESQQNLEMESVALMGSDPYGNVFPKGYEKAYDPINKKNYQKAVVGKVFKSINPFNGYDYYRYKTVYNVKKIKERMSNLPYHKELCHEDNFTLANWSESRTVSVTLEAGVSAEYMGFGASVKTSITEGVTISTQRNIKATLGVEAIHYPYTASEEWEGVTYIQTYSKGGKVQYLLPGWSDAGLYPYYFFLDNQNIGFEVKREVIKTCPGYENVSRPGDDGRE